MRRTLRGLPLLGVLLLIATLLVGGVMLVLSTVQAQRSQRLQADRATELVVLLRDINRDVVDAESAQRGYLISLNQRYLAPYQSAKERIGPRLDRLGRLAAQTADPRQVRFSAQIAGLARAKFGELSQTIGQIAAGDVLGAQKRLLTNEGQAAMERLRQVSTAMELVETGRLRAASARADASADKVVPQLVSLLLLIVLALLLGLWLIMRNADAEVRAESAAELSAARERAELLAHELNHRVKNLFAVVLAIVQMSGRDSPEAKPVAETIADRIRALLKSHEVTRGAWSERGSLRALVDTVLAPYLARGEGWTVEGPDTLLPSDQATPVGLILHELATNAVKYGALAGPDGHISVRWGVVEGDPTYVELAWVETCAHPVASSAGQEGFGSFLLQGSVRQIRGDFTRHFREDGHEIVLRFPFLA